MCVIEKKPERIKCIKKDTDGVELNIFVRGLILICCINDNRAKISTGS